MISFEDVLLICEEFAEALYGKLTDDGKLSIMDAISLALLLIRALYKALKK